MNTLSPPASKPWFREPWPWFLISLPATAVIAGVATVWIAATNADGLVVGDYYKAGLAINQTLARDDTARRLALNAVLRDRDGALSLTLTGHVDAWPAQLTLVLAHPTRPGMDQTLTLGHAGGGHYRTTLPVLPAGKWHAELSDAASTWRLSGVLHSPFSQPAMLKAGTGSSVQ
ncbi:MAG: FixH family protein [Thiobacillus sp.]|uniref:FixH family protein n=1 Tax=Thiobacillus sp. TaxID=924 RepID=UPI00289500A5|nr:FixH family protein [Thiobacillus sp.]MDT3707951.1 FixH family protein [Thiobacillus sp.]